MKGYNYLTEEEAKNFVESFKLNGEEVEIVMNSGEVLKYKAEQDTLSRLQEMQESEFESRNKKELDKTSKYKKGNKKIIKISSILVAISFILGIVFPELTTVFGAVGGAFVGLAGLNAYGLIKKTQSINELAKQKVFMENKDLFTDEIIENCNISQCLSNKKKMELREQEKKTGSVFNLTSIDDLSLRELLELKANILREEEFGLESTNKDRKIYTR